MKVIKQFDSYSSKVELVEIDGKQFVLKTAEPQEIATEKVYLKELKDRGFPTLNIIEAPNLKNDQLLLEYIPHSAGGLIFGSAQDYERFGKIVRKLHSIHYEYCFRITSEGKEEKLDWKSFLSGAFQKATEEQIEKKSDLSASFLKDISKYVNGRILALDSNNIVYSLLHCDLHTGNTLGKNEEIVLYDKGSEIFSGHHPYDLVTIVDHSPNGTYIHTDNPENKNDLEVITSFIRGYGEDFLVKYKTEFNLYMVIRSLWRYPSSFTPYTKEIMENIVYERI
ncbi:MAG: phosphotransferase [Candidatus Doudnabacteria bacterium]